MFPMWVWVPRTCRVQFVDVAAAELFGEPVHRLVGSDLREFVEPLDEGGSADALLVSETVQGLVVERDIVQRSGIRTTVSVWTRTVKFDGAAVCASLAIPKVEGSFQTLDPGAPWRDLARVVVGRLDESYRIECVSRDASVILGDLSAQLVGMPLFDLVHPDEVDRVRALVVSSARYPGSLRDVRLHDASNDWRISRLLVARDCDGGDSVGFALVGSSRSSLSAARVGELETHLQRIAEEIHAAGITVSDGGRDIRNALPPELVDLTTRQREILSLLLEGERVASIASTLCISQSTVRNHLAVIFSKLDIHSQSELLVRVRGRTNGHR